MGKHAFWRASFQCLAKSLCVDLLKVNLLVSGASLVWPRSGRSGRPRATDKGLLESLACVWK